MIGRAAVLIAEALTELAIADTCGAKPRQSACLTRAVVQTAAGRRSGPESHREGGGRVRYVLGGPVRTDNDDGRSRRGGACCSTRNTDMDPDRFGYTPLYHLLLLLLTEFLIAAEPGVARQVGQAFRDCGICPEMGVVITGSFMRSRG